MLDQIFRRPQIATGPLTHQFDRLDCAPFGSVQQNERFEIGRQFDRCYRLRLRRERPFPTKEKEANGKACQGAEREARPVDGRIAGHSARRLFARHFAPTYIAAAKTAREVDRIHSSIGRDLRSRHGRTRGGDIENASAIGDQSIVVDGRTCMKNAGIADIADHDFASLFRRSGIAIGAHHHG